MTESGEVRTLAHVLRREFVELHGELKPAVAAVPAYAPPIADPSLDPAKGPTEPADGQAAAPSSDEDPHARELRELWNCVHDLDGEGRTALCLSGGGVRSAAFNLGVLQGLARLELLDHFHYLSTVSGGGYIGSWLSAWRHRSRSGLPGVAHGLAWPDRIGNAAIPPRRPDAITNLRSYTNYLTPIRGILSLDTWAAISIVGRNLLLNHVVITPLIAALLVLVKVIAACAYGQHLVYAGWVGWLLGQPEVALVGTLLLPGCLIALGWIVLSTARPSWDVRRPVPQSDPAAPERPALAHVRAPHLGIGCVLLGAFLLALTIAKDIPQGTPGPFWTGQRFVLLPLFGAVGALVVFAVALGLGWFKRALRRWPWSSAWAARVFGPEAPGDPVTIPAAGIRAVCPLACAAAAAGAAVGFVLAFGAGIAAHLPGNDPWRTALVLSLAPLWTVMSYNVGEAIYLGLTVRKPHLRWRAEGAPNWSDLWGDEEREWVARTGGNLTVIALGAGAFCLLALLCPELIARFIEWSPIGGPIAIVTVVLLSALASMGLAASPLSTHFGMTPKGIRIPVRTILTIATPIFAGLLIAIGSYAIDLALFDQSLLTSLSKPQPTDPSLMFMMVLAVGLAVISLGASRFVNINRFSLFDLYRMRLTREFLGASNRAHRPDSWTGFDDSDDLPLADLWPSRDKTQRLYPVINATVNMAGTKIAAAQERKAGSFVFTPLYCGSGDTHNLGFRTTSRFANGVKLGWAMSVSGAAVSPNSGYSTLPGLALLMTLFNLRLGIWAGNTGKAGNDTYDLRGPDFALRPLLTEALASTNDQAKYIYLSDGGHFDNLGAYEMLRRRCRFIVISDATCDPHYAYADLGSLVRKAAIDFGIRITFDHLDMARRGATVVQGAYCAYAKIFYPEPDLTGRRRRGYLLYIKSYFGGQYEPADVRAYALANPAFPHDATLNQFFGEAQFESYRALGGYTVMELARQGGFDAASDEQKSTRLARFFRLVQAALEKSRDKAKAGTASPGPAAIGQAPDEGAGRSALPARPAAARRSARGFRQAPSVARSG